MDHPWFKWNRHSVVGVMTELGNEPSGVEWNRHGVVEELTGLVD